MRVYGLRENFKPTPKDSAPRDNKGPREMHDVTCADCGKQTQVPFKPNSTRPVYCGDCYQKHKPARSTGRRY